VQNGGGAECRPRIAALVSEIKRGDRAAAERIALEIAKIVL
jgi:hypothetical protein